MKGPGEAQISLSESCVIRSRTFCEDACDAEECVWEDVIVDSRRVLCTMSAEPGTGGLANYMHH
jgi:hypothetical protein